MESRKLGLAGRDERDERAVTDGFRGEQPEQVEVRRLLVAEGAHLVPGAPRRAEDLEAVGGPDQAHRTVSLLLDGISGARHRREVGKFGEDRPRRHALPARRPPALLASPAAAPRAGVRSRCAAIRSGPEPVLRLWHVQRLPPPPRGAAALARMLRAT